MKLTDINKNKLINSARKLLGTPYKYGARPEEIPEKLDCSSFTQYIYKQVGIDLERSTILQATQGKEIKLTPNLKVGDLLFFRASKGHYNDELFPNKRTYIGHVAMYTENNNAIHASHPEGVIEESVDAIIQKKGPIVMIKRML